MKSFGAGKVAFAVALAALAALASAEERRVGAWSVGLTKERAGTFASTLDGRGGQLGQYCYPEQGTCVWVLAIDLVCEAGDRYPVVVNTESGAAVLEMLCLGVDGKAAYVFRDFEAIDGIVHRARRVVVALPTANGNFRFSQFSLEGAVRAVALMRETAEAMGSRPNDPGRPNKAKPAAGFTF